MDKTLKLTLMVLGTLVLIQRTTNVLGLLRRVLSGGCYGCYKDT